MKPEPGKFYRTRFGEKAKVCADDAPGPHPLIGYVISRDGSSRAVEWTKEGKYHAGSGTSESDLISEWIDKPTIDWSKMPAWAVCVAWIGASREWYWLSYPPNIERGHFMFFAVLNAGPIPPEYAPAPWTGKPEDSLTMRPEGLASAKAKGEA